MDGYLSKPTESRALFAEVEGSGTDTQLAPPFDEAGLLKRLHGDTALAAEIVRLFAQEFPGLYDGIRTALDRRDTEGSREHRVGHRHRRSGRASRTARC